MTDSPLMQAAKARGADALVDALTPKDYTDEEYMIGAQAANEAVNVEVILQKTILGRYLEVLQNENKEMRELLTECLKYSDFQVFQKIKKFLGK